MRNVLNIVEDAEGKFARDSEMRLPGSTSSISYITASGKVLGTGYRMAEVEKGIASVEQTARGRASQARSRSGSKGR